MVTGTHPPAADRASVAVTLYHRHLPKLANEGLIDYERNSISTTDETALTEPYLEFARNWEDEPDPRAKPEGT